ncbi:CpaF family protein [Nocardia sp. NPDC006044]|uniref:CpaF family protein n=1 Tax=Nocardia sp. NPDC006044 TaxID=3364306 RepID=UPI0036AB48AE
MRHRAKPGPASAPITSLWAHLQELEPRDTVAPREVPEECTAAPGSTSWPTDETSEPGWEDVADSAAPEPVPGAGQAHSDLRRRLIDDASEQLSALIRERRDNTGVADRVGADADDTIRTLGRTIIEQLVADEVRGTIQRGEPTLSETQQRALIKAVEDHMFGLGPIQHLIDEPGVTDIMINGPHVRVLYPDGRFETRPPIAESDEEVIDWLVTLAQRARGGGRPFSPVHPHLRLDLPGHIRLTAMAWTVPRPNIAIRVHRLTTVTLDDLVARDMLPSTLARILAAATNGGASQMVSGPMGAGKTTLLRALANALPLETRIGTAETERELYLHEMPGREPYVVSGEVITGGGERDDATGRLRGTIDLSDLLYVFVRMQLEVVIVGEVAGQEIISMFKAMQFTPSSMASVHATDARAAIHRLATIAQEMPGITVEYATSQVAHHVDLIVQLARITVRDRHGQITGMRRFVSEVVYVEPGESDLVPAVTSVYRGNPDGTGSFGSFPTALRSALFDGGLSEAEIPVSTLEFAEAR